MVINFNIGLLGHVDSGKTSLARAISVTKSTAAFDKNPQSQERGITLDLGFSGLLVDTSTEPQIRIGIPDGEQLQLTFVDCPGHASLIRTIIGGAQIIDLMILVIDAQKGIQTQTAECIVIGELLERKLIVAVNKIDLLDEVKRETHLSKLHARLRKTLAKTAFGDDVPIFNVSALSKLNLQELLGGICEQFHMPQRENVNAPLVMYVDHCFSSVKIQGSVCTGTIVQGKVAVNDIVEIPIIKEQRKVKSIQMFHQPVQSATMGDRVGICVTQFNAKHLERGVITKPGYLKPIYAACVCLQRIQYYKQIIKSKSKLHITVGHDTVMGNITLFRTTFADIESKEFDPNKEYEFVDELETEMTNNTAVFALLEFETPILAPTDAILIASKLDMDIHSNSCRLAFSGHMQWYTYANNFAIETLPNFKIFKHKIKQGKIQRLVNEQTIIVQNLFKKEGNRDVYVGKSIELSTGERGIIESTFGQTSKVKVTFPEGLKVDTLKSLTAGRFSEISVFLKFKKYIFNKNAGLIQ